MMTSSSSSSSSSSLALIWLYHVFLSFRGEDVRKGFLSHVLKEFKSKGINVFIDNEIKRGDFIGPVLVGAIRHSRVAVVLISRNYASSSWCLDELVEIMKCREELGQTVMTIFYGVDPSEVRKQTGDFGKAFEKTCVGKTEEVKQAWKQALYDVAGIAGYDASNCGNEADMINKVASDVMAVLGFTPSKDFDDFVGVGARITEIKSKLILQSEQVKVIGIFGPAGIGKTTTARVLYNQLSPDFPFSTFLEDIRGSYDKPCGNDYRLKLRLQKNLLCQIFNQSDIEVRHLRGAQEMLSDKKVLIVLDEVDSWWQLEEMAKQPGWVGPGSVIIITTEDRKLLKALRFGIDHIYKMKYPTSDESLQIFCQYAFGQKYPDHGFERLAREVTWLAGDLPLGLRVMGSYLRGMSRDEWIRALPWLRSTLDREIESTLRFSYDALRDNEKSLFLHLACLFDGSPVDRIKRCFANSSLEVNHGLEVLVQKSLISILYGLGFVEMHRLLQQMGREIVKKQSMENPAKPYFLTDTKEISDVLDEDTVAGNVQGIRVGVGKKIQINKSAFQGMNNIQFLSFDFGTIISTPEGLDCLPDNLILLRWDDCPLRVWPSKFSGKFLVELIMQHSKFEMLWEGIKPLPCLKMLDFSYSENLKYLPDLSKATSLEELHLLGCISLIELTSSIGKATKLYLLDISECRELVAIPPLPESLLYLNAQGCKSLKRIDSSSFQNPNICLNFAKCFNLEQKARNLIQTSACENAVLPGEEVPAHFTHRASSGSLTINLTSRPLPSSFRFKACILLSEIDDYDWYTCFNYSVWGKQNGHTVGGGPNQFQPDLYGYKGHMHMFEDSLTLNPDFSGAGETTFNELTFVFRIDDDDETCEVRGCGVLLLEANDESVGGEDEEKGW